MPSRRRQISATDATLDPVNVKAGSTDPARSTNSRTASVDAASSEVHGLGGAGRSTMPGRRARQRLQREYGLPGDRQRLAARGEDPQPRRAREQPFGESGGAVHEVLGVVKEEQYVFVGDERGDRRGRGHARHLRRAQRASDLGRDLRRVTERRELGEPDAVAKAIEKPARSLDHQPSLPRPARADHGHEPMAVDQRRDLGELALPADEAREQTRQVGPPRAQ